MSHSICHYQNYHPSYIYPHHSAYLKPHRRTVIATSKRHWRRLHSALKNKLSLFYMSTSPTSCNAFLLIYQILFKIINKIHKTFLIFENVNYIPSHLFDLLMAFICFEKYYKASFNLIRDYTLFGDYSWDNIFTLKLVPLQSKLNCFAFMKCEKNKCGRI